MAQINIKVFGKLSDVIKKDQLTMQFQGNSEMLMNALKSEYPDLGNFQFSIAINRAITSEVVDLNEGDEIALLPPFSGG